MGLILPLLFFFADAKPPAGFLKSPSAMQWNFKNSVAIPSKPVETKSVCSIPLKEVPVKPTAKMPAFKPPEIDRAMLFAPPAPPCEDRKELKP